MSTLKHPSNPNSNNNSGTMTNQKTNEDFNKKKPDPTDPNEQKGHVEPTFIPDFGDQTDPLERRHLPVVPVVPEIKDPEIQPLEGQTTDEIGDEITGETADETGNWEKAPSKTEGSE